MKASSPQCSFENGLDEATHGCSDTGAEDLVGCVSTREDTSSSGIQQGRWVHGGSKIPMDLENGVYTPSSETNDKNTVTPWARG